MLHSRTPVHAVSPLMESSIPSAKTTEAVSEYYCKIKPTRCDNFPYRKRINRTSILSRFNLKSMIYQVMRLWKQEMIVTSPSQAPRTPNLGKKSKLSATHEKWNVNLCFVCINSFQILKCLSLLYFSYHFLNMSIISNAVWLMYVYIHQFLLDTLWFHWFSTAKQQNLWKHKKAMNFQMIIWKSLVYLWFPLAFHCEFVFC